MKKKTRAILQRFDITLPHVWGELSPAQVMRVAYYLSQNLSETECLVKMSMEFAGLIPHGTSLLENGDIGYVYYKRTVGNIVLSAEQIAAVSDAMAWAIRPGDQDPMAAPDLDGYITPDHDLYGVSLERFLTADAACVHFLNTGNPIALRTMAATLYLRGTYDPDRLTVAAERISYLPSWQLQAVLLWFSGAKKGLMKKYPYVFAQGGGEAPAGADVLLGMLSSLNSGNVANNGAIKQIDVHEALFELNQKIKANTKK